MCVVCLCVSSVEVFVRVRVCVTDFPPKWPELLRFLFSEFVAHLCCFDQALGLRDNLHTIGFETATP